MRSKACNSLVGMISDKAIREIERIVKPENVLHTREDLMVYECDGIAIFRGKPDAVVVPSTTEEVSEVVKICDRDQIFIVPRGAGTGLSGGATPIDGGVVMSFARMDRIIEKDYANQRIVVQPGVVNAWVTDAVAGKGYFYAPNPSSQHACTIGGNVSHNSGGAICLKYGVTSNHVLGVELVLPDGQVVQLGGKALDAPGYDLTGVVVGSEGTLGVVTKAILRIVRKPESVNTFMAVFDTIDSASNTVSEIITRGIVPAAIEFMDHLAIVAIESHPVHAAGYPLDAEAVLLVEVDGVKEEVEALSERIVDVFKKNNAREIRTAKSDEERKRLWQGRKGAFGAMGSLSPNYLTQDGVVPRSKLRQILRIVNDVSRTYGLRIANVFHAGDGNLHPLIVFDARISGETEKAIAAAVDILVACVEFGGSLTGEHGIGIEKRELMPLIFNDQDIATMKKLRDVFNPKGICNPSKVFPTGASCAEMPIPRLPPELQIARW